MISRTVSIPFTNEDQPMLFNLGQILATPAAISYLNDHDTLPLDLIHRHVSGYGRPVYRRQSASGSVLRREICLAPLPPSCSRRHSSRLARLLVHAASAVRAPLRRCSDVLRGVFTIQYCLTRSPCKQDRRHGRRYEPRNGS